MKKNKEADVPTNFNPNLLNDIAASVIKIVTESRNPNLEYTEKQVKGNIDRVTVELAGKDSEKFTKLGKKYFELAAGIEAIEKLRLDLNEQIKKEAGELFDATDELYTKVIETSQFTLTVSKKPVATKTVSTNYEKVLDGLLQLMPELTEKVDALKEQYTTIKENPPKDVSLRVAMKESALKDVWQSFKKKWSSFKNSIMSWGTSYDKKLSKLKELL